MFKYVKHLNTLIFFVSAYLMFVQKQTWAVYAFFGFGLLGAVLALFERFKHMQTASDDQRGGDA